MMPRRKRQYRNRNSRSRNQVRSKKRLKDRTGRNKFVIYSVYIALTALFIPYLYSLAMVWFVGVDNLLTDSPVFESRFDIEDSVEATLVVVSRSDEGKDIENIWIDIRSELSDEGVMFKVGGNTNFDTLFDEVSSLVAINNLYYLGQIYNDQKGEDYAIWELSNLLGINIDGYIWVHLSEDESADVASPLELDIAGYNPWLRPRKMQEDFENISTNYSKARSINYLRSLESYDRLSNYNIYDLNEEKIVQLVQRESGVEVPYFNKNTYDDYLVQFHDLFRPREVEKEQIKIEVFNGSSVPGQAARFTRIISANGVNVIRSNNAPEVYEKTTLYVRDAEKYNDSLELISNLLPIEPEISTERADFLTTGDIVLVLGEDLSDEFYWLD